MAKKESVKQSKKEIRVVKAADIEALKGKKKGKTIIDLGHELDGQLTELVLAQKSNKADIIAKAGEDLFQKNELSVRIVGETSAALLTIPQGRSIDKTHSRFEEVSKRIKNGDFKKAITATEENVFSGADEKGLAQLKEKLGTQLFNKFFPKMTFFKIDAKQLTKLRDSEDKGDKALVRSLGTVLVETPQACKVTFELLSDD